jgi:lactoylglutathione lyase
MTQFLHSMIRVRNPAETLAFFALLDIHELRRKDSEAGRFTLIFLAAPGQAGIAEIELTHNWDDAGYDSGRNFGHLAFAVDDIYACCARLAAAGVPINRPPRDGHMAFVKTPDGISIELLQAGDALPPAEPWLSMANVGSW